MKLLLYVLALLIGFRASAQIDFVEETTPPARQVVKSSVDFGSELTAVTEQVKAKFDAGKTNEADLEENLTSIKNLILKYLYNGKREQLAQLYLLHAHIYVDGLNNISRGRAIWTQVARDFPSTSAAKIARDLLSKPDVNTTIGFKTNAPESLSFPKNSQGHSSTNSITISPSNNDVDGMLLKWNLKTTLAVYENTGHTSPKWDNLAKKALNAYARVRAGANLGVEEQTIITNSQAAIAAGCNDPLVLYLNTRYTLKQQDLDPDKFDQQYDMPRNKLANAFCESARILNESQYPPIRKFYSSFWAAIYLNRSNVKSRDRQIASEARYFEELAISNLVMALTDKTTPPEEIYDNCKWLCDIFQGDEFKLKNSFIRIEPELFANHEKAVGLLVKGWFYIATAWQSRGDEIANKVTAQGWVDFNRRLEIAENALSEAWELNPHEARIPTAMLTVELGQGKGRERMEMWFTRAMKSDPNNAVACSAKLYYLEPQWYGSKDEVMAFCRECLNSKIWGGKVPLVLANKYAFIFQEQENFDIQDAMKSAPGVFTASKPLPDDLKDNFSWDEVQQAYKKYFEKNPGDIIERQKFVFLAGKTRHWSVVNEQLPYINNMHSVEIFGHDFVYEQIVRQAQQFLHQKIRPPRIFLRQPNQRAAKIGDTITLRVDAQATYLSNGDENNLVIPNYFQWQLNGTNLLHATNSTYTIEHAGLQDSGEYTVVVTNLGGSVTSSNGMLWVRDPNTIPQTPTSHLPRDLPINKAVPFKIAIQAGPPTIVSQPMRHKTKIGRPTSFIVRAGKNSTNEISIGVQWQLNGKDIIDTTNSTSEVTDWGLAISARHFIKSVALEDAGNYSVIITNLFGSVMSSNAALTVETR